MDLNSSEDHSVGGFEDFCPSCSSYKQEIKNLKSEQETNYKTLKEKIIQTDKLIKCFTSKSQECDVQAKKLEDISGKFESTSRECQVLSERLQESIAKEQPLIKARDRLEKKCEQHEKQLEILRNKVQAYESQTNQLHSLRKDLENKISTTEALNKDLTTNAARSKSRIKSLEDQLKKANEDSLKWHNKYSQVIVENKKLKAASKRKGRRGKVKYKIQEEEEEDSVHDEDIEENPEVGNTAVAMATTVSDKERPSSSANTAGSIEEEKDDEERMEVEDVFRELRMIGCLSPVSPLPATPAPDDGGSSEDELAEMLEAELETDTSMQQTEERDSKELSDSELEETVIEKTPVRSVVMRAKTDTSQNLKDSFEELDMQAVSDHSTPKKQTVMSNMDVDSVVTEKGVERIEKSGEKLVEKSKSRELLGEKLNESSELIQNLGDCSVEKLVESRNIQEKVKDSSENINNLEENDEKSEENLDKCLESRGRLEESSQKAKSIKAVESDGLSDETKSPRRRSLRLTPKGKAKDVESQSTASKETETVSTEDVDSSEVQNSSRVCDKKETSPNLNAAESSGISTVIKDDTDTDTSFDSVKDICKVPLELERQYSLPFVSSESKPETVSLDSNPGSFVKDRKTNVSSEKLAPKEVELRNSKSSVKIKDNEDVITPFSNANLGQEVALEEQLELESSESELDREDSVGLPFQAFSPKHPKKLFKHQNTRSFDKVSDDSCKDGSKKSGGKDSEDQGMDINVESDCSVKSVDNQRTDKVLKRNGNNNNVISKNNPEKATVSNEALVNDKTKSLDEQNSGSVQQKLNLNVDTHKQKAMKKVSDIIETESHVVEDIGESEAYVQPSAKKRISLLWAKEAVMKEPKGKRGKKLAKNVSSTEDSELSDSYAQSQGRKKRISHVDSPSSEPQNESIGTVKQEQSEFDRLLSAQMKRTKTSDQSDKASSDEKSFVIPEISLIAPKSEPAKKKKKKKKSKSQKAKLAEEARKLGESQSPMSPFSLEVLTPMLSPLPTSPDKSEQRRRGEDVPAKKSLGMSSLGLLQQYSSDSDQSVEDGDPGSSGHDGLMERNDVDARSELKKTGGDGSGKNKFMLIDFVKGSTQVSMDTLDSTERISNIAPFEQVSHSGDHNNPVSMANDRKKESAFVTEKLLKAVSQSPAEKDIARPPLMPKTLSNSQPDRPKVGPQKSAVQTEQTKHAPVLIDPHSLMKMATRSRIAHQKHVDKDGGNVDSFNSNKDLKTSGLEVEQSMGMSECAVSKSSVLTLSQGDHSSVQSVSHVVLDPKLAKTQTPASVYQRPSALIKFVPATSNDSQTQTVTDPSSIASAMKQDETEKMLDKPKTKHVDNTSQGSQIVPNVASEGFNNSPEKPVSLAESSTQADSASEQSAVSKSPVSLPESSTPGPNTLEQSAVSESPVSPCFMDTAPLASPEDTALFAESSPSPSPKKRKAKTQGESAAPKKLKSPDTSLDITDLDQLIEHAIASDSTDFTECVEKLTCMATGKPLAQKLLRTSCSSKQALLRKLLAGNRELLPTEKRIVELAMIIEQQSCGFLDSFIREGIDLLHQTPAAVSTEHKVHVCRVLSGVCQARDDVQCIRVIIHDLLLCKRPNVPIYILAVTGVWPKPLHIDNGGWLLMSMKFIICDLMLPNIHNEKLQKIGVHLDSYLGWKAGLSAESMLPGMLASMSIGVLGGSGADTVRGLCLLAAHMGWSWANNTLVVKHIWPTLSSWAMKGADGGRVSEEYALKLIKLLGSVTWQCPLQHLASTTDILNMLVALHQNKVSDAVTAACKEALLRLAPLYPQRIIDVLAATINKTQRLQLEALPSFYF